MTNHNHTSARRLDTGLGSALDEAVPLFAQEPDTRDETIASLRALLKAKDEEIADLTRDRSRFEGRAMFANPGSALRAASSCNPRNLPCPTCGEDDRLTPEDSRLGYQCDECADRAEGRGGYE